MNRHLSSREISEILIGGAGSRHARECADCASEVRRMKSGLENFRASVDFLAARDRKPAQLFAVRTAVLGGGRATAAGFSSLLVHAALIAVILLLGSIRPVTRLIQREVTLIAPDLKPYLAEKQAGHGGGGGGARSPLNASAGKLPKPAPRQFTPPRVDPPENPKLPVAPTIVAETPLPNIDALHYGDPLSRLGVPSNGTGLGGGIGDGIGTGVGIGKGPGVGPGSGGGFGGGAYRIGGGVSAPAVLSKVEPEYSEEARKAKWQGTVVLQLVVDEHGMPREMKVTRSLGLGLDQKAIEAVAKWRFKPGMKDGKPVPVIATIEVNFRLL